ncbi:peptidoglycan DD-metalloendopeptidase family protein [Phaeovulum vinaykumarii]|uniref:Murein DD-endopeptidase MepM and murein hydrolase activator NlpD, contain LysM domain n=1 Tax=Phaeovulum vinaykumarii TaxID=407234 RepID=A0A1N7M3W4_9RHOB|nr:peptidoglycan DD-metalloendopeptidase family protein [Phaeovulum vinaykumarii]SIS80774.1 Murein DD-endopeptidase MepM and murein hydrolase activator NlpD, contain LysM domain [Phaeovulum vinaykumarii]SOC08961.1 murein DD-endopeptidase MepM/ murein hydrolase activator NlpD [Phaeovulum vinaykumarii]
MTALPRLDRTADAALLRTRPRLRGLRGVLLVSAAAVGLAACDEAGNFDPDLRRLSRSNFSTTDAARHATADRPAPDARGVISYPNYQVVVSRRGDKVADVAARVGVEAGELARYNALDPDTVLGKGEVLALPRRVAPAPAGAERVDITTLASGAIDRASAGQTSAPAAPATPAAGPEPIRHKVTRGETAYSIARYYDVPVRALAEWNGLPSDLGVREGQYLMIPVAATARREAAATSTAPTSAPGQGSATPVPPSAAMPLPAEKPPTAAESRAAAERATPPRENLAANRTAASNSARMQMPVQGAIIRPYQKKKNEGIDIAAKPGTAVQAAADGTVAAITKDTDQVPILVIRHDGNLLTVYANIDNVAVAKGAKVSRGQTIARVRAGTPGFVHFEVRQGFESVDPMPYLQ